MLDNLPGLLNVALCAVIVLTLFFYRRRDSRHKPLVSWLALAADAAVCLCAPQLSVWSPVSNGLAGRCF